MQKKIESALLIYIDADANEGCKKLKTLLLESGVPFSEFAITRTSDVPADQIEKAEVLIVYIGPKSRNSKLIDAAVRLAHKLGKRIVGVWATELEKCEMVAALDELADAIVGWNGESIIDAVAGVNDERFDCHGAEGTYRKIKRFKC